MLLFHVGVFKFRGKARIDWRGMGVITSLSGFYSHSDANLSTMYAVWRNCFGAIILALYIVRK